MSDSDSDLVFVSEDVIDPPQHTLDCFRAYGFITENPQWGMTVLFMGICQFIPIAGPLALLGYQFELAESLLRQSRPGSYPEFDFGEFPKYLMRGLWPFLVAMIAAIILVIPMMILMWVSIFAFALLAKDAGPEAGLFVGIGVVALFLVIIALSLVLNVLLIPLQLRAGYCQDIGKAFDFQFVKNFMRLMWKETLIAILFLMVSGMALGLLGLLLCFVGVYFAAAVVMLAQAHLIEFQLYSIYLARGGEPIPLKQSESSAAE